MDSLIYPSHRRLKLFMCISDRNLFKSIRKSVRLHVSTPSSDMSIYHEFHRNRDNTFAGNNGFSRKIHGSESKVLVSVSVFQWGFVSK